MLWPGGFWAPVQDYYAPFKEEAKIVEILLKCKITTLTHVHVPFGAVEKPTRKKIDIKSLKLSTCLLTVAYLLNPAGMWQHLNSFTKSYT